MTIIEKIKYFPTLLKNFFKILVSGLFKAWGSGIIIIILILHIIGGLDLVFLKININIKRYSIERRIIKIKDEVKILEKDKIELECLKGQIIRVTNNQEIDSDYCNHKI